MRNRSFLQYVRVWTPKRRLVGDKLVVFGFAFNPYDEGFTSNIFPGTVVAFVTSPSLTFAPTSSVSLAFGREPPLLL